MATNKNFEVKNGLSVAGTERISSAGVLTGSLSGSLASATTATTQSASDNSTKIATTAYVTTAVSNLIDSSPSTLNTLNELAAALGDDANFSTTITNSLATKLSLSGGTLTGALTGTSAAFSTSSTTDHVLRLTDDGVADYDTTFPDTATYQLQTNTTSNKTFKLINNGSGTFNLNVEGSSTLNGNVEANDIKAIGSGGLSLQTDEGTKRIFIADNGDVKVGNLAAASATTAPLHVAKANQDVQAIFGDNNDSIDDPSIRIIGRNSANSSARYAFLGLDADANHGFLGYNAGAGGFVNALSFDTSGNVGVGTNDPQALFEIERPGSNSSADSLLRITAQTYPSLEFYSRDSNSTNRNWKISSVYNSYGTLEILRSAAPNGAPNVSTLAINSSGSVGIGTHDPTLTNLSGSNSTIGLEIRNVGNDTSAALRLTGSNNTGSPGQLTNTEIIHKGDVLRTHWRHAGSDALVLNSTLDAHLFPGEADTRMYFGSEGGIFGGNGSHNIRASSSTFMFNSALSSSSTGHAYIFETAGSQKLFISGLGKLTLKTANASDDYTLITETSTSGDPGIAIVRPNVAGFGIAMRASTVDYTDFQMNDAGIPSYTETGKMRIYSNGNISIPSDSTWASVVGHQFYPSGSHYMVRNSTSSGNETFIISNQTGTGGAVGVMQYRYGGSVRGQYLIATDSSGIYFSGSSDYRFKENVETITDDHLTKLTSLRPITYTEVGDSEVKTGFIAHEVEEVYPEFVEGEKDAVWTQEDLDAKGDEIDPEESVGDPKYQTLAYTKKEWNVYIIRALQQLKEENEALKARIETLEG